MKPKTKSFSGRERNKISTLDEKGILKTQLRAILKAGSTRNIKIMHPMITNTDEIQEVKILTEEIKKSGTCKRGSKF